MTKKSIQDFYHFDRLALLLAVAILVCVFTIQRQKQKLVDKKESLNLGIQDVRLPPNSAE